MKEVLYNRSETIDYAQKWAMKRNPRYLDFQKLGGDCTNFASQCIYAGCNVMNYTKTLGWYYNSSTDRSPSWTGVQYLYNYITRNKSVGPYGFETTMENALPGDIVQLKNDKGFYHSLVIVMVKDGRIYVAAHTIDVYMRPLDTYVYNSVRFIHIAGARKW